MLLYLTLTNPEIEKSKTVLLSDINVELNIRGK